jgi:rubrerythrin
MGIFDPSEVFQFAIRIEENGEKFYREMAQKLDDKAVKQLFSALADEEVKHRNVYKDMVAKIEKYEPFESFPGEYFEYLRAYADNHIFSADLMKKEMDRINDPSSALAFAMQRELDSILYYTEVKKLVAQNYRQLIDQIIEEERKHYVKLTGCKKSTDASCVSG